MRLAVVAFAAGAWWLQQQPELPPGAGAWLLAASAAAGLLRLGATRLPARLRGLLVIALAACLGYAWTAWRAESRLAEELPARWEGRDIELTGVVAGLPRHHERYVRFEFDVEAVHTASARVPGRIVLSWWGRLPDGPGAVPALEPGERWRLTVRLKRPHGMANPHGFDYEAWLFERGLRATGYVRPGGAHERLARRVDRPSYWIERLRGRVRARIHAALPEGEHAGILVALAIGDQRSIIEEQWRTFTRTGVNHLMSISGLHVTMVSSLVFAAVFALWRRSPRLVLALPAQKAAVTAALAAAFAYALMAGYSVPTQRTVYMLAVVAAALWAGTLQSTTRVLCVALFVVVLADPWAVLAPGFWLSFGAVAVIAYVSAGRIGRPHWLFAWTRVQLAISAALVPALLAFFQQVPLISPLANAVAIPVVSLVVVPLSLIGTALPVDAVLKAAHGAMGACMAFLEALGALPLAVWQQATPPAWSALAALVSVAWLLAPRGTPARWLGLAGFLPLLLATPPALRPGEMELTVLDVGQGLSVLVRTARHALLYDAGPRFGPGADAGSRVIVPFLRGEGISRLDAVIVSHDDVDHWGGSEAVLREVPVAWIRTSLPDFGARVAWNGHAVRCEAGARWVWDGVEFELLHPAARHYAAQRGPDNDLSCVLRVAAAGGRVLMPGDIERRPERELVSTAGARLRAEVLVAPHQGSRTSSTLPFVRAVDPRVVIFPVGYRNRFGHPHSQVLERYRARGARLHRTDRDGALRLQFAADGTLDLTPHRAARRRYWFNALPGEPVPAPARLAIARAAKGQAGVIEARGSGSR